MLIFYFFFSLSTNYHSSIDKLNIESQKQGFLSTMYSSARERITTLLLMTQERDYFSLDELNVKFTHNAYVYTVAYKKLLKLDIHPDDKGLFQEQEELAKKYSEGLDQVATHLTNEQLKVAKNLLFNSALKGQELMLIKLRQLQKNNQERLNFYRDQQQNDFKQAHYNFIYLVIVFLIVMLFFFIYFYLNNILKGQSLLIKKSDVILNTIHDAIFYLDKNGLILDANSYAISLLALNKESIIGCAIDDIYHVSKNNKLEQFKSSTKLSSIFRHQLTLHLTNSDQSLQVQDSLSPILDDRNKVNGYVLNIQDISIFELNRRRLEEEKKHYLAIFDSAVEGIMTFGDDGVISSVNNALLKIFRYDESDLFTQNIAFLFKDDHANIFVNTTKQSFDLLISPFIGTKVNMTGLKKNGRPVYVNLSISDTHITGERRYSAIVRDITQEKNLKEQMEIQTQFLSEEKTRYSALFDTAVDAIITISDRGLISSFNKAAEDIFQYSHKEVFGKNISILMPSEVALEHDDYLVKFHETGIKKIIGQPSEVIGRRKDGTGVPLMLSVADTNIKGEKRFSGILRNITSQKFSDRMLKKAVKVAETAMSSKSKLLDTMSHEIRTPLNGILGMGELLEDTSLSLEQRAYIQSMNNSGKQLLSLVNDILDYSKLDAQMMTLESAEFNFEQLCADALSLLTGQIHLNKVNLILDYDIECPKLVVGDSVRTSQILNNLLNNAFKFTHQGFIRLKVRYLSNNFHISIQDTGIGISDNSKDSLFNEFTQIDSSTTREFGGTGLGLSITKRIIHLMGGSIDFTSLVDIGTEFTLILPLKVSEHDVPISQFKSSLSKEIKQLNSTSFYLLSNNEHYSKILTQKFHHIGVDIITFSSFSEKLNKDLEIINGQSQSTMLLLDNDLGEEVFQQLNKYYSSINTENSQLVPKIIVLSLLPQLSVNTQSKYQFISASINKLMQQYDFIKSLFDLLTLQEHASFLGFTQLTELDNTEHRVRYSGAHVLVVDDVISNQYISSQFLEQFDIHVTLASNGVEAIEMNATHDLDLILMDCRMPVMDGYEATKAIRKQELEKNIPIIAMTANSAESDHLKCVQSGMNGLLMKPFHRADLEYILSEYLSQYKIETAKNPGEIKTSLVNDIDVQIDQQVLSNLSKDMGDKFEYIVDIIIQSLNDIFVQTKKVSARTPHRELVRLVHSIKSPAANIGAVKLKLLATKLEEEMNNNSQFDVKKFMQQMSVLFDEFELVRQALKKHLPS